jgi:acetyl esterase/lipase
MRIPNELRSLMATTGPIWLSDVPRHVKLMSDEFSKVLGQCDKSGVEVCRDIAYGPHSRNVLDVYSGSAVNNGPVVVFMHGGAFVDGNKDKTPEFYANVMYALARRGVVAVNVEYRLAPEFKYPSATVDLYYALGWVANNIAGYGANPKAIYLMGHSAGAAHVSTLVFHPDFRDLVKGMIAGLIIVSGRLRVDNRSDNPNARKVEAYYGTDSSVFDSVSANQHISADLPVFVAFAEYENALLDIYCLELAHRIATLQGKAPAMHYARGHNHTSIVAQMNTDDDSLTPEIIAFIERCALR